MFRDIEQWNEIRMKVGRRGVSIREIQRQTGLHFNTIKKILANPAPLPFDCPERPKPKIGPYLERIGEILDQDKLLPKKQRHTAKRIFERIHEEGYLLRLVERETFEREQRAAERRIRAAKFPVLKTLDTFDFKAQPGINRTLIVDLMRGEYMEHHENILFVGNPGTGKTHLATALGHAACAQGKRVRFISVTGLVTQLLEARQDRGLERLLKRFEKLHLLILDELGYVPFSKAGAELLFEVISRAYERQSLILTTNLPFEQWTEILGNERLTGALLDRITHRVHIYQGAKRSFAKLNLRFSRQRRKLPAQRRQEAHQQKNR